MSGGLPGLAGTDHVGFTVPDIEAATRFFVDVVGCILVFEIGPFESDDDWMQTQLGVDPRAVIRTLRMFRCKTGPSFEIFEYELEGAGEVPLRNSDVGGHHLAFYVEDIGAAVAYLKSHGITVQGDPVTMESGPTKGLNWVYFLSPWGIQLELVSYPAGMAVLQQNPGALWSPKER
jgi:catechol 2,3-dioxygenase-like lactoylglutathione lyase family enzyme